MKNRMKKIFSIWILILFCVEATSGFAYAEDINTKTSNDIMSQSEVETRLATRKLWESLAILERNYIVSTLNDFTDADEAKDKLIKHMNDLGSSIQPYYGYLAKRFLTYLLKKDVLLMSGVVKAVKIDDTKKRDRAIKKWHENALALANFLARTHNQTKKDLTDILYKHQELTQGEIQAMLKKDGVKDLEYYDKDRAHMLMFSDVLMDGLVKEFPDKFEE